MKGSKQRKVEDFMSTATISVKETDTVTDTTLEMQLAGIRHVPVVDSNNHVIGVVSDRDMLRAVAKAKGGSVPIAAIMTRHVRTVRPETPAVEAVSIMIEHKFGCLPVVGDEQQLVGIVTETDFLCVAREALMGRNVAHEGARA